MRILMYATCAGPQGVWRAGDIVDVPDGDARALIDAGWAEAERDGQDKHGKNAAEAKSPAAKPKRKRGG